MHTSFTSTTSHGDVGNSSPVAMDTGPIASVTDGEEEKQQPQQVVWSLDETGWPVDEEGWQVEGHFDEHSLNFVKGAKGEGKG